MNTKQTNKDKIYVYSSSKQFCLPVFEFLAYWNVFTVIFFDPEMLGFVN